MLAMSLLRRPGLLLSAAVTITVPGVLAVLAVLGHEHAAFDARSEAVSLGSSAPPASLPAESLSAAAVPATPAAVRAAGRDAAAEMEKIPGLHAAAFGDAVDPQQRLGMRLLSKSATAGLTMSYQGVELIAQSSVNGAVTMISDVWHQGGGLTVTQTSDAGMLTSSQPYVSYDVDNHSPEGVFGVTKTLVALLGRHYVAVYRGTGITLGRPALVVELERADGSLAARFWLDRQTLVPLRRDVYDTSAQLVSEDAFVQVQFGALTAPPAGAGRPAPARRPGPRGPRSRSRRACWRKSTDRAGVCPPPCRGACRCTRRHRVRRAPARWPTSATRTGFPSSRSSSSAARWCPRCPAGRRST